MNMTTIDIDLEWIQITLFDMYDIRDALSARTKSKPKSEGSDETIGECLNDTIEFLEVLETIVERGQQAHQPTNISYRMNLKLETTGETK